VFSKINIDEVEKEALLDSVKKKMIPAPIKIRSDFELKCFTKEGIDAIRTTLLEAKKKVSDEHMEILVSVIVDHS